MACMHRQKFSSFLAVTGQGHSRSSVMMLVVFNDRFYNASDTWHHLLFIDRIHEQCSIKFTYNSQNDRQSKCHFLSVGSCMLRNISTSCYPRQWIPI